MGLLAGAFFFGLFGLQKTGRCGGFYNYSARPA
jgi:hypothetical protein